MNTDPDHPVHSPSNQRLKPDSNEPSPRIKRTSSSHVSPWKEVKSSSEQINGRYHHSSILHQGLLYVYGGFDNNVGILADFRLFNCKQEKIGWKPLSTAGGPGSRHSHSAVLFNQVIYLLGGKIDRFKSTNSLYGYYIKQGKWKQLEPHTEAPKQQKLTKKGSHEKKCASDPLPESKPAPIDSHQAAVVNNQMVVYGGFSNNQFRNDIYCYNFETHSWRKAYPLAGPPGSAKTQEGSEPEPRSDFSMVAYEEKLFIYAGKNLNRNFNDLWQFDLRSSKFTKIEIPSFLQKRSGHSAVVYKNYMIIFGGITSVTHERDDMLCYCFKTNSWMTLWANCQDKEAKKRIVQKKLSNTKIKSTETGLFKSSHQQKMFEKPRKYRRPLAEEKLSLNFKKDDIGQKERHKKQNERKILFINQLELPATACQNSSPEQYSPLIQSLSNSIMLTSNAQQNSANSSSRERQKQLNCQTEIEQKPRRVKARDGHTAHVLEDEMIIFGGDRHMFAINDVVYISLEYFLENGSHSAKQQEGKIHFDDQPIIFDSSNKKKT